jgi:hypothetical protein
MNAKQMQAAIEAAIANHPGPQRGQRNRQDNEMNVRIDQRDRESRVLRCGMAFRAYVWWRGDWQINKVRSGVWAGPKGKLP